MTLPWVHFNPAKPAHIDLDTGIFPWGFTIVQVSVEMEHRYQYTKVIVEKYKPILEIHTIYFVRNMDE